MRAVVLLLVAGCGRLGFFTEPEPEPEGERCTEAATWKRSWDWAPGGAAGTTTGNPTVDSMGRPVWSYDVVTTGGALRDATPWFTEPTAKLVWDDSWYGDIGVWARGDDRPPNVSPTELVHTLRTDFFAATPILRWHNPLDTAVTIELQGQFHFYWSGDIDAAAVDVDAVIMTDDGTELFASTIPKPTLTNTREETVQRVAPVQATVAVGGSILVSHRARASSTQNHWIYMADDFILTAMDCP